MNVLTVPWLISDDGWSVVVAVVDGDEQGRQLLEELRRERLAAGKGMNGGNARALTVADRVATLPVCGPIFRHANIMTELSDASTDGKVRADVESARAMFRRGEIDGAVLEVDSPGGEAAGTEQTAKAIRDLAAEMPVVAFVEDRAQSKALWYASAATKIVAAPQAMLGSIGVRMRVETDATDGKRQYREIVNTQSPGKRAAPLDDEVMGRLQVQADDLGQLFIDRVAEYRGVTAAHVAEKFGGGDSMIAGKALQAGLIDQVGSKETAIAALRALASKGPKRMSIQAIADIAQAEAAAAAESAELAAFGRKALTLLGTDLAHADEALAAVKTGAEAIIAQAKAAAEAKTRVATEAKKTAIGAIEAAFASGQLELGSVTGLVDFLGDEEAAAALRTKLEAAAGDHEQVSAALGEFAFTAADSRRIGAYLAGKAAPAKPTSQPADTEQNHAEVAKVRTAAQGQGARVFSIASIAEAAKNNKENAR